MEKYTFSNLKVQALFNKRERLSSDFIKSEELTKEFVSNYNAKLKEAKTQDKIDAFKVRNCTIDYKGRLIKINPCFTVTEDGKELIIFRNIDANSYIILSAGALKKIENDDAITFENEVKISVVKRLTEKANMAPVKDTLVKKCSSFEKSLLSDITAGLTFDKVKDILSLYSNKKDITCPKVLAHF